MCEALGEVPFGMRGDDAIWRQVVRVCISIQFAINPVLEFWVLETVRKYFRLS